MNLQTEKQGDQKVLGMVDLTLRRESLQVGQEHGEDLTARIDKHEAEITRVTARVRALETQRERLLSADSWQSCTWQETRDGIAGIRAEIWDSLVELHSLVAERREILKVAKANLQATSDNLAAKREQVEKAVRRRLKRSTANSADWYLDELVGNDEAVRNVVAEQAAVNAAYDVVTTAWHLLGRSLSAITWRQREVFSGVFALPKKDGQVA
jgi:chromosome segregation ATPase